MLFDNFNYKSLNLKNKIVMAPMCQYSCENFYGKISDWHRLHYESRAIVGEGLIIIEDTSVEPDVQITKRDLGLYNN